MTIVDDYIGQKFNYLTVLSQFRKGRKPFFLCQCDCGREKEIDADSVKRGLSKTCGATECRRKLREKFEKDYTNQKFNHLTVISQSRKGSKLFFLCRCDCGREKEIWSAAVKNGNTKSCGMCNDCTGQKFNHLTVLSRYRKGNESVFLCRCDCGREKEIRTSAVRSGNTKSCGMCQFIPKGSQIKDYTGQKFNHLTILSQFRKNGKCYSRCRCDCGYEKEISLDNVIKGITKTCRTCEYYKKLCEMRYEKYKNNYNGQKFHLLTVLSEFKKGSKSFFLCRCDCGHEKAIPKYNVLNGTSKTCGTYECQRKIFDRFLKDHTGQKFNHLTVLSQFRKNRLSYFNCRCECGQEKVILAKSVIKGITKTCGSGKCRSQIHDYKRMPDYTGQKFNYLTVLSQFWKESKCYFRCLCDCGREKTILAHCVVKGTISTCGAIECRRKIFENKPYRIMTEDNIGKKFNRLTVLSQFRRNKRYFFLCRCDCGCEKEILVSSVKNGDAKSCGCLAVEHSLSFGEDSPCYITLAEDSSVMTILQKMGYEKDGRKKGVFYQAYKKRKPGWVMMQAFQRKPKLFYFHTYQQALEKRLELQEKIYLPFILRNKHLLPEYVDIDYWVNLNSNIEFDYEQYKEERIARAEKNMKKKLKSNF